MSTPLEDADRLLDDWSAKATRIDQNLVDLTSDPLFEALQKSTFEGKTRERVAEALATTEDLFTRRRLLEDVIDQARAVRATVTAFRHGHRLIEIDRLLRQPSIGLSDPVEPATARRLLDPDEHETRLTPAQVLASMVGGFDRVRSALADVRAAWDELTPKLDGIESEAGSLADAAHAAGPGVEAQYRHLEEAVTEAQRLLRSDPLGAAPGAIAVLPGNVAALRRRLPPDGGPPRTV